MRDKSPALLRAWDSLKERFWNECPNTDEWVINEEDLSITHESGSTGVMANVETWWRNVNAEGME